MPRCLLVYIAALLSAALLNMQVSIARATHTHFTVFLSVFGVLGLLIFSTVRAGSNPAVAMPNGVSHNLPSLIARKQRKHSQKSFNVM